MLTSIHVLQKYVLLRVLQTQPDQSVHSPSRKTYVTASQCITEAGTEKFILALPYKRAKRLSLDAEMNRERRRKRITSYMWASKGQ